MEVLVIIVLLLGVNFVLWSIIGWIRMIDEFLTGRAVDRKLAERHSPGTGFSPEPMDRVMTTDEVAIIIPAYNEELTVAKTIRSGLQLVPSKNIYVNTYGSSDHTAEIADAYGVRVLDKPEHGKPKAEKLEKTLHVIREVDPSIRAVMFVDADTWIDERYLDHALPHFKDPEVVAVAGYATTEWDRDNLGFWNRYFIAYRERMYFYMQLVIKHGQTWKRSNVSPIVPGFASLYRIEVLSKMDINPPGLVIEDFNMTFELHHKKLGKIAHHRTMFAVTQDPDNFRDYYRQVLRWDLGFWQTVQRHGLFWSPFWVALGIYILEVTLGSVVLILLPFIMLIVSLPALTGDAVLAWSWFESLHTPLASVFSWKLIFFGVLVPDYLLSVITALVQRRPQYLWHGLGFIFLRYVDAWLYLYTFPRALITYSSGQWQSPTRR